MGMGKYFTIHGKKVRLWLHPIELSIGLQIADGSVNLCCADSSDWES